MNITYNSSFNENDIYDRPDPYPDFSQIKIVQVLFIVMYVIVMVMAVFGNAIVCGTVYTNRKMHTAVNYYIVNLAACDFMVGIFVLPIKLIELTAPAEWALLNDALCTTVYYLQTIFVFASVLTLVAICIERYLAVVHPLKSRIQQTKRRAKKILLVTWIIPCCLAAPFLYPMSAFENVLDSHFGKFTRLTCFIELPEKFITIYYTFLFITLYVLPLIFITGTCFKVALCLLQDIPVHRQGSIRRQENNRRKVAKMVLIVIFAFMFCWTPYFLVTIITIYQDENFMHKGNFFFTSLCINLLAFINSCINPVIYCAMSTTFRFGFRRFFKYLFCCFWNNEELNDNFPSDGSTNFKLPGKRRRHRGHTCQMPMSCLVTQSSSESGSGSHSDTVQQTAVDTYKFSLLRSASNKLKRNLIVHYLQGNQSIKNNTEIKSQNASFKTQNNMYLLVIDNTEPPLYSPENPTNNCSRSDSDLTGMDESNDSGTKKTQSCSNLFLNFSQKEQQL